MRVKFLKPYRLRLQPLGPVVDAKPGDILDDEDHPGSILPGLVREGAAVLALEGERGIVDPRVCLSGESVLGAGLAAMLAHSQNTLSVEVPAQALEELPDWLKAPVLTSLAELRRHAPQGLDLRQLIHLASQAVLDAQQALAGTAEDAEAMSAAEKAVLEAQAAKFAGTAEDAEALAAKLNEAPPPAPAKPKGAKNGGK